MAITKGFFDWLKKEDIQQALSRSVEQEKLNLMKEKAFMEIQTKAYQTQMAQAMQMAQAQEEKSRPLRQVQTRSDLDNAVFKTPIDTLVNLWVAKYGADWVEKEKVINDDFFEWAAIRLRSAGMLEEHAYWDPPQDEQKKAQEEAMEAWMAQANIQQQAMTGYAYGGAGALGGLAGAAQGQHPLTPYGQTAAVFPYPASHYMPSPPALNVPSRHVTVLRIILREK